MTSGNLTDEPICYEDDDARRRLGDIADGWLLHDRPIHVPCDDSVIRVPTARSCRSGGRGATHRCPSACLSMSFRPWPSAGELKNTFCLASGATPG